jgi:hypothetical protein
MSLLGLVLAHLLSCEDCRLESGHHGTHGGPLRTLRPGIVWFATGKTSSINARLK